MLKIYQKTKIPTFFQLVHVCFVLGLLSSQNIFAQQVSGSFLANVQLLAQDRIDLNRCINHTQFAREAGSGSRLGIDGQSLSDQIDRLANDLQYSEKGKLLNISYTNMLRQSETLAKNNSQSKSKSDELDINFVCSSAVLEPIRQNLLSLEKNFRIHLK